MQHSVTKILVANRGEIAVRIIRACREMGIAHGRRLLRVRPRRPCTCATPTRRTASARPRAARELPAHRQAHRRRAAGPAPTPCIPGYGFLAENAEFAAACRDAGLTFIGPSPEAIALMGSKTAARADGHRRPACRSCPAPQDAARPGRARRRRRRDRRRRSATRCWSRRWPAAAARACARRRSRPTSPARCAPRAPRRCRPSATPRSTSSGASCGRATSRCSCSATTTAPCIPFVERECSIQRRHQKVVEESPSPVVDAGPAAAHRRRPRRPSRARVGYTNAGTIEFLLDATASSTSSR